jgi:hypothetical protein
MKTIKSIFVIALGIAFLWSGWSAVKPFWSKYWLKKDMELAAVYGTKHNIEETKRFLDEKMKAAGRDFEGGDFEIEKDQKNDVHIRLHYEDSIRIFGYLLKDLDFRVEAFAREVKEYF